MQQIKALKQSSLCNSMHVSPSPEDNKEAITRAHSSTYLSVRKSQSHPSRIGKCKYRKLTYGSALCSFIVSPWYPVCEKMAIASKIKEFPKQLLREGAYPGAIVPGHKKRRGQ